MKLAREFIGKQAAAKQPFFVQVCFGSPHSPHQGTEEFKAIYKDAPEKQRDFLAELSGVDAAVGELRAELKKLNIADNTLLWFTSDNGGITPNSQDPAGKGKMNVGVRTVSVLEWPARIKQPIRTSVPAAHVDMYPTLLEITGVKMPGQLEIDGISLLPLFDGKMTERNKPLGFMLWNEKGTKFEQIEFTTHTQGVWIDGKYKLIVPPIPDPDAKKKQNSQPRLFDIFADPAEEKNLAAELPDVVARMRTALDAWRTKVRRSFDRKEEPAVAAAAG
jgi:arylsulfatase A-like enzyme